MDTPIQIRLFTCNYLITHLVCQPKNKTQCKYILIFFCENDLLKITTERRDDSTKFTVYILLPDTCKDNQPQFASKC